MSITILIILAARQRSRMDNNRDTYKEYLKRQFQRQKDLYLGHTKSSGSSIFFAYGKLEIILFFYRKIERRLLYFSMLFDHYSYNIIVIEF